MNGRGGPIHKLHREIRTVPDESEPARSYEEPSMLLGRREDELEEDFHQKYASNAKGRRDGPIAQNSGTGGSFWRTQSEVEKRSTDRPAFSSMAMKGRDSPTLRTKKKTGLLGSAMKSQEIIESNRPSSPTIKWSSTASPQDASRRKESLASSSSSGSKDNLVIKKKREKSATKARNADRHGKFVAQSNALEMGQGEAVSVDADVPAPISFAGLQHGSSLERSSSDQSTGSLLYGKTPLSSNLHGKSGSLIFPTGVDSNTDAVVQSDNQKRRSVNLLLDQCETVRFSFKKKLILNNMGLVAADLPVEDIVNSSLGNSLHKLSMAGNSLGSVPSKLVLGLSALKHLDISQCELHQLPDKWNLPQLKRLNVSHNRLRDFPEEGILGGLPELQELNMYGNKVAEVIIPNNPRILKKLETLNLGYNDLAYLPDDLDRLKALRTLKVLNNFLEKVPMRVCEMDLKVIDVSSNPVIQPPQETCDRGICSMRRYYHCLRMEEQSKPRALEEVHKKVQKGRKPVQKKKIYGGLMKSLAKPTVRKSSDDSSSTSASQQVRSVDHLMQSPRSSLTDDSSRARIATKHESDAAPVPTDLAGPTVAPVNPIPQTFDQVTVNDTLKVIFVGMAKVGKTSMIRRLIGGQDASIPTHDERTVGVDIYEWDPKVDQRFEHIDCRIRFQSHELSAACGDVDVKLSVWDFAGQHVYHATHELFFSNRALYVLVWDMGATNRATHRRTRALLPEEANSAFKLSYDSSDDESDEGESGARYAAEEARRADSALERDIDEKVQFWVDCIQSSAPGSAILPVASFADVFARDGKDAEARRRCNMLKNRLMKHEERRIQGIKQRLQGYMDQNRASDPAAVRLRKLLCDYTRPKLIFGEGDNSVVRVSGAQYTGFESLTAKIIGIASGRDKGQWRHPIFHGHIGARIPRMRLEVREAVRSMRDKFKVVEWGYFVNQLKERNLHNIEDISDALHFLASIGELSYFGGVMPGKGSMTSNPRRRNSNGDLRNVSTDLGYREDENVTDDETDDEFEDPDTAILSMDDTSATVASSDDGSLLTVGELDGSSLSQFVFLNPRWLVAAVACILRHDLDREIKETRRRLAAGQELDFSRAASFYDAQLNCPVITADDACLLWQAKRITKKAAERAQANSNNMTMTPFEFLQLLLIRFGVFVPIDLSIDKAFLGGKEYAQLVDEISTSDQPEISTPTEITGGNPTEDRKAKFFFLPSLLGSTEPTEAWTFKNSDSWKTTLCHSILFPDGVPPGLMERLMAAVLSSVYAFSNGRSSETSGSDTLSAGSKLTVKEVLCWRTAFLLKLGTLVETKDGYSKESIVDIFGHIADKDSHLCVGSNDMKEGMRRLMISGRGQAGDDGRKIWNGGYRLVAKCVQRAMGQYGGVEYEKQAFCPDCLAKKAVGVASYWEINAVRSAVMNSHDTLVCRNAHVVRTALVAGPTDTPAPERLRRESVLNPATASKGGVPIQDLLRAIVVVGLWDDKERKVVRVGSGFIVDRKRGLIVTASHTLMNIWGDKNFPFGENYYGLRQGKVVIGVIPSPEESTPTSGGGRAVFRYFANIVAKDKEMETGLCQLDACVLRITTRLENDVGGNDKAIGDQPERILMNNYSAMKEEKLKALRISETCELEEEVRIVGYNQGGEGLLGPGESLNLDVDFAKGYVCKMFTGGDQSGVTTTKQDRFKPREEIVVICPTIGGHSGGPCVNQQGEVIGILSRADPAENQRCYISPTKEWKPLVKAARRLG